MQPVTGAGENQPSGRSRPALVPPTTTAPDRLLHWGAWLAIVAAAVTGIVLRWWHLTYQSLWFDEGYTTWVVSLSPTEILRVIRNDISPPLYYLLLHAWVRIWGDSEMALRGFSATAGSLAIGVFFFLARAVLVRPGAVAAAMWLMALSALQVQYAQEARFYELSSLLALLGVYSMLRLLQAQSQQRPRMWLWLIALTAASAATVYIHNMMFFYLVALGVAWLIWPSTISMRRRLAWILLANAIVALLYLPWVPSLLYQMAWIRASFWASRPSLSELLSTSVIVAGVKNVKLHGQLVHSWASLLLAVLLLSAIAAPLLLRRRERSQPSPVALGRSMLALAIYALLPLLAVFIYSQRGIPVFIERVFAASSAVFPLLLAGILAYPLGRWARMGATTLVACMLVLAALSTIGYWRYETKEQWREACQYVDDLPGRPRLVVFVANEGETLYRYYARRRSEPRPDQLLTGAPQSFFDLDPPRTIQRVTSDADLTQLKAIVESNHFPQLVLVLSHTQWSDPDARTIAYLRSTSDVVEHKEFRYVDVYWFRPRP
jgi:uncharacterized membrane protein